MSIKKVERSDNMLDTIIAFIPAIVSVITLVIAIRRLGITTMADRDSERMQIKQQLMDSILLKTDERCDKERNIYFGSIDKKIDNVNATLSENAKEFRDFGERLVRVESNVEQLSNGALKAAVFEAMMKIEKRESE